MTNTQPIENNNNLTIKILLIIKHNKIIFNNQIIHILILINLMDFHKV